MNIQDSFQITERHWRCLIWYMFHHIISFYRHENYENLLLNLSLRTGNNITVMQWNNTDRPKSTPANSTEYRRWWGCEVGWAGIKNWERDKELAGGGAWEFQLFFFPPKPHPTSWLCQYSPSNIANMGRIGVHRLQQKRSKCFHTIYHAASLSKKNEQILIRDG